MELVGQYKVVAGPTNAKGTSTEQDSALGGDGAGAMEMLYMYKGDCWYYLEVQY